MNILFAEAIGGEEGLVGVDDVFLVFEVWNLVHEDFDSFFVVAGMNHDFIKGVGEGGVFGGDFEETLIIHDENNANVARFENWDKEVGDVDGTRAFFKEEMSIVEAENDVFGGIDFVENADHEVF